MMHPDTEIQSRGGHTGQLGVFSTADIPKGTIVFVKDDLDIEISRQQYQGLGKLRQKYVDKYAYAEASGTKIVSWDQGKYVNHCCRPNSMSTGWGPEIAIEDIPAGREITDEYGLLNIEAKMTCLCGVAGCRGTVTPDDIKSWGTFWDEQIQAALIVVGLVEQPLWHLLPKDGAQAIEGYANGKAPYRSVMTLQVPS